MQIKTMIIISLIFIIIIQFIRPAKNISLQPSLSNIAKQYTVPADVDTILKRACYDCHSNNTKYPWYAKFQPVYWWLNSHIKDGKHALNFDAFTLYPIAKQYKRMNDITEEIKQGDMPLPTYSFEHKEARLTADDKQKIYNWCNAIRNNIASKYPADSLIIKKK